MKRLLALLVALLLIALPALAEPMSTFDYTDDILEDGSLIYYFPEISLQLPAEWRGKVMALEDDRGVSFYQIASYEKYQEEGIPGGGFLFELGASVNSSFSELPSFEYLGFSERSAMNYYLELPTDYPAYNDADSRAEYDAMCAQIGYVVEHASIYPPLEDGVNGGDVVVDDAETTAGDAQAASWTPQQVRYQFEHRMLPRYFYDRPESVLNGVGEVGLYWLWESVTTENGVDPTYPAELYAERWYAADDGTTLVQVELPDPDANTLCYRIYFVYNANTGYAGYYTVEYDDLMGTSAFICTWDAAGNHSLLEGAAILERGSANYEADLRSEAARVAELAGVSAALTETGAPAPAAPEGTEGVEGEPDSGADVLQPDASLVTVSCPEQGFSIMADADYSHDYQEGTGLSIYTENEGSIPYVIVFRSEDLLGEPLEYIKEQYTPHIQAQYGDDLVAYVEYEIYDVGGKQLPAGLYTYRLQGYLVNLLRIYDSTGAQTVTYTAKYLDGEGDATLAALDAAVRYFQAD